MIDKKIKLIKMFLYFVFIAMIILVVIEYQVIRGELIYNIFGPILFLGFIVFNGILRIIFMIILIRNFTQLLFKKAYKFGWIVIILLLLNFPIILESTAFWINSFLYFSDYKFIIYIPATLLLPIIYMIFLIGLLMSNSYLKKAKITLTNEKLLMIKKTIIDLGTSFTRLEIQDVAEESNMSREIIDDALNTMINQEEIYGSYDKETGLIDFDQDTNIDEIDNLMKKFSEWEQKKIGKKIS